MASDDGFQLVSKRKAARASHRNSSGVNSNVLSSKGNDVDLSKRDVLERIESCRKNIIQSDFWISFLGTAKEAGLLPQSSLCLEDPVSSPLCMNGHIDDLEEGFERSCQIQPQQEKCDRSNTSAVNFSPTQKGDSCEVCTKPSSGSHKPSGVGNGPFELEETDSEVQVRCTCPKKGYGVHCSGEIDSAGTHNTFSESGLDSTCDGLVTNGDISTDVECVNCDESQDAGGITHLVCYGLGRFATCHIARHQLAFLLALRDQFKICGHCCYVYDPVFREVELEVLTELSCSIISFNEEGKRKVSQRSLFFMPHCGTPLYNNLLWANWSLQTLPLVTVLGNSFGTIETRTPTRVLLSEAHFMAKVFPHVTEHPVKNNFRQQDIFNDLSLHSFNAQTLGREALRFWTEASEPVYPNNVEIVQNKANRKLK